MTRSATLTSDAGSWEVKTLRFTRSAGWRPDSSTVTVFWSAADMPRISRAGDHGNVGGEFALSMTPDVGTPARATGLLLGPSGVKVVEWDFGGGAKRASLVEISLTDVRALWVRRGWLTGKYRVGAGTFPALSWREFLNSVVAPRLPGLAATAGGAPGFAIRPAAAKALSALDEGITEMDFENGKPALPEVERVLDEVGVSLALSLGNEATLFLAGAAGEIDFAPPAERIDADRIEFQESEKRVPEAIDVVTDLMAVDVPLLAAEPVVVSDGSDDGGAVVPLADAISAAFPGVSPEGARAILGAAVYREAFSSRSSDAIWQDAVAGPTGVNISFLGVPVAGVGTEAQTRLLKEHAYHTFRVALGADVGDAIPSPGLSLMTPGRYAALTDAERRLELAQLAAPPWLGGRLGADGETVPPLVRMDRVVARVADAPRFLPHHDLSVDEFATGDDLSLAMSAERWAREVLRIVNERAGAEAKRTQAAYALFPATATGAQLHVTGINFSDLSHEPPRFLQLAWWRVLGMDDLSGAAEFDGATGLLRLAERAFWFADFLGIEDIEAPPPIEKGIGGHLFPGASEEVPYCVVGRYWAAYHQVRAINLLQGGFGGGPQAQFQRALNAVLTSVVLQSASPTLAELAADAFRRSRVRPAASIWPLYFGTGVHYTTPCYGFAQPGGAWQESIRGSLENRQEATGPLNHNVAYRFVKEDPPTLTPERTLLGTIPEQNAAGFPDVLGFQRPERGEFFRLMEGLVAPPRAVIIVTKIKSETDLAARLRFRFGANESTVPVGQSLVVPLPERPRRRYNPATGELVDNFAELAAHAKARADAVRLQESGRVRGENYGVVGVTFPAAGAGGAVLQFQIEMPADDEYMTYIDSANPYVGFRGVPAVVRRGGARTPAWSR